MYSLAFWMQKTAVKKIHKYDERWDLKQLQIAGTSWNLQICVCHVPDERIPRKKLKIFRTDAEFLSEIIWR